MKLVVLETKDGKLTGNKYVADSLILVSYFAQTHTLAANNMAAGYRVILDDSIMDGVKSKELNSEYIERMPNDGIVCGKFEIFLNDDDEDDEDDEDDCIGCDCFNAHTGRCECAGNPSECADCDGEEN